MDKNVFAGKANNCRHLKNGKPIGKPEDMNCYTYTYAEDNFLRQSS